MSTTDRSIIPSSYGALVAYLYHTDQRQLATNATTTNPYWTDYGWGSGQSGLWTTYYNNILGLFTTYDNPLTKTKTAKQNLDTEINNFLAFEKANDLILKIKAWSGAGNDDANTFHFDLVTADPTHLNSKISTKPTVTVESSGPGAFDIHCRTATDANRASIDREHGATEVQFAYAIFDHAPTEEEQLNPDDTDVFHQGHSVKAHFPFMAGAANRRKYLITYWRWANPTYPQFTGDWSDMQTNIIA